MISVELWRARIGAFNSKRYSGFLSSLFSSYVPFKFHRRRKRYAAQEPPPAATASLDHSSIVKEEAEPLLTISDLSSVPSLAVKKRTIVRSIQNLLLAFFVTFSWLSFLSTSSSSFKSLLRSTRLNKCVLREAIFRLVLLIVIISQALIISGDVELNPGPDPGSKPTLLELKTMRGADDKPLRIVQTIAAGDYATFGMCLLKDENGDEVELIEKDHSSKGAADITQAILKKWLKNDDPTRTYKHLIECLKLSQLGALAELITEVVEKNSSTKQQHHDDDAKKTEGIISKAPQQLGLGTTEAKAIVNASTADTTKSLNHDVPSAPSLAIQDQQSKPFPTTDSETVDTNPSVFERRIQMDIDHEKMLRKEEKERREVKHAKQKMRLLKVQNKMMSHFQHQRRKLERSREEALTGFSLNQENEPLEEFKLYLQYVYKHKMKNTFLEGPSLREYLPFNFLHHGDCYSNGQKKEVESIFLRIHNYRTSNVSMLEISELGKWIKRTASTDGHVIIKGFPGMGKTAFAWELCHKWASGEVLQDWSIVILINLCNQQVREAKLLSDFLYYPDQAMRKKICQDLTSSKGKHVLIIVDGLDHLNKHQIPHDSVYQQICEKKLLPNATLMFLNKADCVHQRNDKLIQAFYFTKESIDNYITSACSGDDRKLLASFKSYLSSHPYIHTLMHIPAQCVMITDLYRLHWNHGDTEFAPSTLTELYTDLVSTFLLRYLCCHLEYGQKEWVIENFVDLPEKAKESFMALAHVAAKGIEDQKYVFDLQEDLKTEFESFGLMQRVEQVYPGRKSESYIFLDLTLQEYMAAYYCSQQDTFKRLQTVLQSANPVKYFLPSYCKHHWDPLKSIHPTVMLFTAGLTKFSWDHQLLSRYLQTTSNHSTILLSTMHLLYETQSPDFIRLTFSSNHDLPAVGTDKYGLLNFPQSYHHTSSTDCFVAGYCISHSNRAWLADGIHDHAELLSKGLNISSDLQWSSIGHVAVLDTEAKNIPLLYPHTQKVIELTIQQNYSNKQENDCTDLFTKLSTYCLLLKSLTIYITPTTRLTPLFHSLPSLSSLESLFFCLINGNNRCIESDMDNLSDICKQLQACPIKHRFAAENSSHVFPILPLSISSKLHCLDLFHLTLTPALTQSGDFSSLKALKLNTCLIPDDACSALVQFLQSPQCVLKEIILLCNDCDMSSTFKLIQGIGSNCTLNICYIEGRHSTIIKHLVAGLQESKNQSCLEELMLHVPFSYRIEEQSKHYDELIRLVNEAKTIKLLKLARNANEIVRKFDIRENLEIAYYDRC